MKFVRYKVRVTVCTMYSNTSRNTIIIATQPVFIKPDMKLCSAKGRVTDNLDLFNFVELKEE